MIKNFSHAKAVQTRRKAAGKEGLAKAVRRWLKHHGIPRWKRELEAI